jgi:hypothetical protein
MDTGEYASFADHTRTYRAEVNGIRDGKFTLSVRVAKPGKVVEFSYPDVPVKKGTNAVVSVDPGRVAPGDLPALAVTTGETKSTVPATLLQSVEDPKAPGSAEPGTGQPEERPLEPPAFPRGQPGGTGIESLGIEAETATAGNAGQLGVMFTPGVIVLAVRAGSPADAAGLEKGDIILYVGKTITREAGQLASAIDGLAPPFKLELTVLRNHQVIRMTVSSTAPAGRAE